MEIIDNFLPEDQFQAFSELVNSYQFPWFAPEGGMAYKDDGMLYFVHTIFHRNEKRSNAFPYLEPFVKALEAKALLRVKVNMYPRTNTLEKHPFHVDYNYEHKGALFFINTNDGVTTLEDGTEIESVANRLLMFDPSKPHCSSSCTNQRSRLTMNINYF